MTALPVGQLEQLLRQSKRMFMSIARILKTAGHFSVKEQRALGVPEEDSRTLWDSQQGRDDNVD